METTVKTKLRGGPHGIGDPDDLSLRKVELEVLIPQKIRDVARLEMCTAEVQDFSKCCKDSGLSMVFYCRKENSALRDCLSKWYHDEGLRNRCVKEYLQERSEYRRTGIGKPRDKPRGH